MINVPVFRLSPRLSGFALVFGMLLTGCGGEEAKTVTNSDADSPAVKGKGSMDYYRSQMKGAAKGAVKK